MPRSQVGMWKTARWSHTTTLAHLFEKCFPLFCVTIASRVAGVAVWTNGQLDGPDGSQ